MNKISTLIPGYHNNNVSITCLEDNIAILENKISYIEFDRKTHILTVQEYANMPFDSIYKVKLDYPLKGREQCWLAEELIKSINENKVLSVKFNHEFKSGNIDPLEGDQGTDSLCIIIEKKPNVPKQQWNLKRLYYLNLKLGGIIDACDIDFSNREDVIKSSDNTSYFAKKRDNLQQLSDAVKDYAKKTHKVFGQNNRHMNYDHSDKLYGSFASKIKEDYDALSKIEKE